MSELLTLRNLARRLADGAATSSELAERALDAIEVQRSSNVPAFIHVEAEAVKREARASDERRKAGRALSAFDGIPFGVKDLFDIAGQVTAAGSVLLKDRAAAAEDSDPVAALRAKGLVVLGRTNMTEFAYSGLGLNPHHGTPPSVFDRRNPRIPGGSSSGSAVAVADGVCAMALGTDTGGSCRIPAAFNGICGFKPTASRISKRGVFPLSTLLDSVGPLAASADCCAIADDLLSGGDGLQPLPKFSRPARLAVLNSFVMDGVAPEVSADFERAVSGLRGKGFEISAMDFDALRAMPELLANGGIVAREAWDLHRAWLAERAADYDPRVASRIAFGANTTPEGFARLLGRRSAMIAEFTARCASVDAVICPAVAMVPPPLSSFASDESYRQLNALALRNTYVFNFLDATSGVVPMHQDGAAPTGFMLSAPANHDGRVLALMQQVSKALQL